MKYSIIDIETTGGSSNNDKIIEFAVFIFDGKNIIDEFSSLVNPNKRIPYRITTLTGIDDEMVADAPQFYEIAKKIIEITQDTIFVAHNVGFDYGFIKNEFKSLGYEFEMQRLCSYRMARQYLPGYPSYSLGKLCGSLGIELNYRHRAAGDARATVELFKKILDKQNELAENIPTKSWMTSELSEEKIQILPSETGIYKMFSKNQQLIYVGKANSIKKRIIDHLKNDQDVKTVELRSQINYIEYEIWHHELWAFIHEAKLINLHKPWFNRALLNQEKKYGVVLEDNFFKVKPLKNDFKSVIIGYKRKSDAINWVKKFSKEHSLCFQRVYSGNPYGQCPFYFEGACSDLCNSIEINLSEQLSDLQINYPADDLILHTSLNDKIKVIPFLVIKDNKMMGYGIIERDSIHLIRKKFNQKILKEQAIKRFEFKEESWYDRKKILSFIRNSKKKNVEMICF